MAQDKKYPVTLDIDYSDKSDRLTTLFRIILIIPIFIVLSLVSGGTSANNETNEAVKWSIATGGILVIPTLLMILFRQKYPKWWFNWNLEFTKFFTRVFSYLFLLRDEYPSTDEDQAIHINIPYPNVKDDLVNWMPLVKWLLAIPHIFVLAFLTIGMVIAAIIAWFAIIFTGTHPKGIHEYIVGVFRWWLRVDAYALLLTTDEYPPFSLK